MFVFALPDPFTMMRPAGVMQLKRAVSTCYQSMLKQGVISTKKTSLPQHITARHASFFTYYPDAVDETQNSKYILYYHQVN